MSESQARRRGVRPVIVCAIAGIALLAAAALVRAARTAPHRPASSAEVAASLAQGVAWIWPNSNGPQPPYREAAVLVESLTLRAGGVERGGRTQPMTLPAGVRLVPVVHVESAEDAPDVFKHAAVLAAVRRHAGIAAAGAGLLQLDFEAPLRQRDAYRALVAAARGALPAGVRLSVTVLAHWCTQGDWLDRLSVDEVVPMLYHLGPHADDWRRRLEQADAGLAGRCRGSALGFATHDPPSPGLLARATRSYWFDDAAWANPSRPPRHLVR